MKKEILVIKKNIKSKKKCVYIYIYIILFFLKKEKEKREIDIVNFMNKSGLLGLFIVLFHVHFAYKFHGCFTLFL